MPAPKQIFGYTEPSQAMAGEYVKFIAVFEDEDGNGVFQIRNGRGVYNEIIVPRKAVMELADELTKHSQPETTV